MVVAVWSVKGGAGVSSLAVLLAVGQAERAVETLLVDLCGEIPAVLGVEDPVDRPGLGEWCALDDPSVDGLRRIEVPVRPGLQYLPKGTVELSRDAGALLKALHSSSHQVIVDCGLVGDDASLSAQVVQSASTSLLVTRDCYLHVRATQRSTRTPTSVVVIKERGRTLGRTDIELAAGAPVVAEVACDEAIARAIDSGLTNVRLPRKLIRSMAQVVRDEV